jgi:translation initiation factor IF-1
MNTDTPDDEKNENFVLDVELVEMIDTRAFRAVLKNGHTLVAYLPRHGQNAAATKNVGDHARVVMSPFDMSRGAIVTPWDVRS